MHFNEILANFLPHLSPPDSITRTTAASAEVSTTASAELLTHHVFSRLLRPSEKLPAAQRI